MSTTSGLFSSSPLGSASTGNNPWAIAVTPGGRFAYVASLGTQGNVNELSIYSINQQTGVLTLQNSLSLQGAQPASLAMDSEARFLYVGRQQPTFNRNLEVYSINPSNGGLSLVAGVLLSDIHGGSQGPIAVTAEPQGQFIYAIANNELVAFAVNATTGALTPAGTPVGGVFEGGANGGVGDPFFFAASGTSPVWQDNCTIEVDSAFPFDGCPVPFLSSGPGSGGGGGNPLPAATFVLTVSLDPAWGGNIVSSPAGIDYSSEVLSRNTFQHAFPNGSTVSLRETPASAPVQAYDVRWTGSCSGTGNGTSVVMSQDQHCYLSLTPVSTR